MPPIHDGGLVAEPPHPDWLPAEPSTDVDLGVIRQGKEAQVDLVERTGADDRTCLLAVKRYLPRSVRQKGQLEALGVQRASTFRHDVEYREGRQFRRTRDRRAVEQMTAHGRALLQARWTHHEHGVLERLWHAGVAVPYPVSFGEDELVMEYVGARDQAAPHLSRARLGPDEVADAWRQLLDALHDMTAAGIAHGDLSAYNLLWWEGRLVVIDLPQAVEIAANPRGLDFLHRDVLNVAAWFARHGLDVDGEATFAELLAVAPWSA